MSAAQRRRVGLVLLVVGPAMLLVGVAGLLLRDDPGRETPAAASATPPAASPAPTAGPGAASTPASPASPAPTSARTEAGTEASTETPAPPAGADVRAFIADLAAAIRDGDAAFLFTRLHPAVLERYGAEQCRQQTAEVRDETHAIDVEQVRPPAPWDYATDDLVTTVPEAVGVDVVRRSGGQQVQQQIHVASHGGQVRWFTDCGTPG